MTDNSRPRPGGLTRVFAGPGATPWAYTSQPTFYIKTAAWRTYASLRGDRCQTAGLHESTDFFLKTTAKGLTRVFAATGATPWAYPSQPTFFSRPLPKGLTRVFAATGATPWAYPSQPAFSNSRPQPKGLTRIFAVTGATPWT